MELRPLLLAALSSVLLLLSFPNFNYAWIAWVALVPLLMALRERSAREAFWLGWLAGTLAYSGVLYWLIVTFRAAHVSLLLASGCLFLLSAYLGLFWGLWTWAVAELRGRLDARWFVIATAAAWVALEFLRTYLFSGFPWTLFGDSQARFTPLIQLASLTGVYGISFLIVLVNVSCISGRKALRAAGAVVLAICFVGRVRLNRAPVSAPAFRVALLQGSIDQYKKWDANYVDEIKKVYDDLCRRAAVGKPDLIVWPETSVPGYLLQDPPLHAWLIQLIQRSGTTHLVGAPALEGAASYNAVFLIGPTGAVEGGYAKTHLVPFGEILPAGAFLGRFIRVLNQLGGFTAGHWGPVIQSSSARIGVNICYEAIFPALVRRSVIAGAQLIVNVTNDGWYMKTAAPYQHLVPNIFRAVENGRWLVRADNTGISAIIDPYGRVIGATPIYEATVLSGNVALRSSLTIYTRIGDAFAWLCCAVALGTLLFKKKRGPRGAVSDEQKTI